MLFSATFAADACVYSVGSQPYSCLSCSIMQRVSIKGCPFNSTDGGQEHLEQLLALSV